MNILLGFMRHNFNKNYDKMFIEYAINNNVKSFEVCEFYMNHACENYVYDLLNKFSRAEYCLYGKMPKYIIKQNKYKELFYNQIQKVPSHYFDYYLLQAMDETSLFEILNTDIIEYFLQQKKEGKIKFFGISIQCAPDITKIFLDLKCWDFIQMPLNYFDWFFCYGKENYELVLQYNLPIIAQSPLKGGVLTDYHEAYSFIANLRNIQTVLCGNTKIETLKATLKYLNNPLNIEKNYYLNKIQEYKNNNFISCLGCNRCSQVCSAQLPLLTLIQLHNRSLVSKECFYDFNLLKHTIGEPCNNCLYCYKCQKECPLHLDIPDLLKHQIFELRT